MGFEGKKIYRLKFEDPAFEGLEVTARAPTIEQGIAVAKRAQALGDDETATIRAASELLCECLIEWNLTNDGKPVPHTAEALLEQDATVTQAIVSAWEDAALTVSGPLGKRSSSGEQSLEASLPMELLSPSLVS